MESRTTENGLIKVKWGSLVFFWKSNHGRHRWFYRYELPGTWVDCVKYRWISYQLIWHEWWRFPGHWWIWSICLRWSRAIQYGRTYFYLPGRRLDAWRTVIAHASGVRDTSSWFQWHNYARKLKGIWQLACSLRKFSRVLSMTDAYRYLTLNYQEEAAWPALTFRGWMQCRKKEIKW